MSSNPSIPLENPGKFSTLLVVVSCPPAAIHPAINPSNINGLRLALAAYIAAVCPAGPDQIITMSSILYCLSAKMLKC
jgi:hypothetical protein